LRQRLEDIPALIDHFLARLRPEKNKPKRLSRGAYQLFMEYSWPGNIRELENAIEHAIVMSEGEEISVEDLPAAIQHSTGRDPAGSIAGGFSPKLENQTLEEIEKRMLSDALKSTGYNHTRAARKLGITRRTLGYRIDKYGLPRRENDAGLGRERDRGGADYPQ
jgi:DNA-binding NtrC family response regulator